MPRSWNLTCSRMVTIKYNREYYSFSRIANNTTMKQNLGLTYNVMKIIIIGIIEKLPVIEDYLCIQPRRICSLSPTCSRNWNPTTWSVHYANYTKSCSHELWCLCILLLHPRTVTTMHTTLSIMNYGLTL